MSIRLTVIGGGPGGYTAAFAAARAGMSVTLVESGNLGGTCLNNGCIPTKTLKASADALELALRLSQFGITGQGVPAVDPAAVLARKEKVCATLRGGLEKACASLGVRLLKGRGRLVHAGLVEASTAEGPVSVEGDRVILATGSGALELPGLTRRSCAHSDQRRRVGARPGARVHRHRGRGRYRLRAGVHLSGLRVQGHGGGRTKPSAAPAFRGCGYERAAPAGNEETPHRLRTGPDAQGRARGGRHGPATLGASPFIKEPTPAQMKETPIEAETVLVTVGRAPNTAGSAGRSRGRRGRAGLDTGRRSHAHLPPRRVCRGRRARAVQNHAGPCRRRRGPVRRARLPRA